MKGIAMLTGLALMSSAHAGDDPQRFMPLMRAGVPDDATAYTVRIPARAGGTIRGTLLVNHEPAPRWTAILRIGQPSRLAGTAVLVTPADDYGRAGSYVYMPAVRRVRHVEGSLAGPAVIGVPLDAVGFEQLVAQSERGVTRVRVALGSASGTARAAQ
jgi:hypothetical protein